MSTCMCWKKRHNACTAIEPRALCQPFFISYAGPQRMPTAFHMQLVANFASPLASANATALVLSWQALSRGCRSPLWFVTKAWLWLQMFISTGKTFPRMKFSVCQHMSCSNSNNLRSTAWAIGNLPLKQWLYVTTQVRLQVASQEGCCSTCHCQLSTIRRGLIQSCTASTLFPLLCGAPNSASNSSCNFYFL